jgi:hypothetical protein
MEDAVAVSEPDFPEQIESPFEPGICGTGSTVNISLPLKRM